MQREIDTEKMGGLKVMDFNNPPTREIGYQAFPKAIYLHPKDKSKEARCKVVANKVELDEALRQGWRLQSHVPLVPNSDIPAEFEADIPAARK